MGKERAKRALDTAGINSSLWPTAWKARSQFRDLASMKKRFRIVAEENRSRFSRKKRKRRCRVEGESREIGFLSNLDGENRVYWPKIVYNRSGKIYFIVSNDGF